VRYWWFGTSTALLTALLSGCAVGDRVCLEEPGSAGRAGSRDLVQVITKQDGDTTRFFVENGELCEITMTLDVSLVNLRANRSLPYTAVFPPNQTTEALSISPITPKLAWDFSFTNNYRLGSKDARHDDSCVYLLPYLPGHKFVVTQAANGSFSHKGPSQYAIDWKMPKGTVVCAARSGTVVKVKADSDRGGSSIKFDRFNNYVLIRHEDGTLGHYCHLQHDSLLVNMGDRVEAGQPIARSGNTGFSTGPHLHFCVLRAKSGVERESIPVRFEIDENRAVTLKKSDRYEAISVGAAGDAGLDANE